VLSPDSTQRPRGSAERLAPHSSLSSTGVFINGSSEFAIANPAALTAILKFSIPMHLHPCQQRFTGPTADRSTAAIVVPLIASCDIKITRQDFSFFTFSGKIMFQRD